MVQKLFIGELVSHVPCKTILVTPPKNSVSSIQISILKSNLTSFERNSVNWMSKIF